jgi:hypothetical protein
MRASRLLKGLSYGQRVHVLDRAYRVGMIREANRRIIVELDRLRTSTNGRNFGFLVIDRQAGSVEFSRTDWRRSRILPEGSIRVGEVKFVPLSLGATVFDQISSATFHAIFEVSKLSA